MRGDRTMMSVIVKPDPRQQMIESAVAPDARAGRGRRFLLATCSSAPARRAARSTTTSPSGKAQLVEEATRYAGEFIAAGLAAALREDDPVAAIRGFAKSWRRLLEKRRLPGRLPRRGRGAGGRPHARAPATRRATPSPAGRSCSPAPSPSAACPPDRARSLSTLTIASVEGAVVLARAEGSSEPLERVADELTALVAAAAARSLREEEDQPDHGVQRQQLHALEPVALALLGGEVGDQHREQQRRLSRSR